MLFASCSSFLCITKHGAMPSMPRREEVLEFMKKYEVKLWIDKVYIFIHVPLPC